MAKRIIFATVLAVVVSVSAVSAQTPASQAVGALSPSDQGVSQRDMAKASSSTRVDPLPSFEWSLLPYLLALVAGVFAIEATRQWWRETEWRRELRRCQSGADEHQRPIPLLGDTHPFQRDNLIAHTPTLQRSLARH